MAGQVDNFYLFIVTGWIDSRCPQGGQLRRLRPQGMDEMLFGRLSHVYFFCILVDRSSDNFYLFISKVWIRCCIAFSTCFFSRLSQGAQLRSLRLQGVDGMLFRRVSIVFLRIGTLPLRWTASTSWPIRPRRNEPQKKAQKAQKAKMKAQNRTFLKRKNCKI